MPPHASSTDPPREHPASPGGATLSARGARVLPPPALLAAIVEAADDAIYAVTLDGRITIWNAAAERLYGYPAAEVMGTSLTRLAPPDRLDESRSLLARLAAGERIERLETVRLTRDGRQLPVSLTIAPARDRRGTLVGASVVARDSDPARQARARETARRELLELMPAVVVGFDGAPLIRLWNRGAVALFGWAAEEMVGQPGPPELRALLTDEPMRAEVPLSRRDGSRATVVATAFPVRDADGKLQGHLVMAADISELRATQAELAEREALLRRSEATFRLLFDANPLPMWVYDLETLRFLEVNDTAVRRYGYSHEEFLALRITDIRPLEDVASLLAHTGRARPTLQDSGPWRHRLKDGTLIDVEITSHTLSFEGRPAVMVVAQDVSHRLAAQRALGESEARFRALFEQSSVATIMHRAGVILAANAAVVALFGYHDAAEVLGTSAFDYLSPRSREAVIERAERRTSGVDEPLSYESIGRRRDGTEFPVHLLGASLELADGAATLVYLTDLTEQQRAQAERDRLASAVEQSVDNIVMFDLENRIIYVNPAVERSTGFSRAELLGQPATALAGGLPVDEESAIAEARAAGRSWSGTVTGRRRDGKPRQVEFTISPVRDAAGKLVGAVSLGRDITRERALEAQLRQAQKMEAVGRLAGGVAHDFNNLLTIIAGNTQLLLEELGAGTAARAEGEEIANAADRAASLTRQLLAFSRKQVLAPVILELGAVVTELAPLVRRLVGEDVRVSVHADDPHASVRADRSQIEQVVMNLVVNARDAMPQGGLLTIATSTVELDAAYGADHVGVAPGPHVQLTVSDTGVGMDAETRSHLFEPFFTTKELGKGTGLGLAMVDGIVRQSGGHIWVYSEPGLGTTFKIYFPQESVEGEIRSHVPAPEPVAAGTPTVLLVEDETGVRALARRFLAAAGYTVLEAAGPAEARELIAAHAPSIDLLLTDIVMPGGGGPEIARALAAANPVAGVVYMSGYSDETITHHGVLEPGTALLHKPFSRERLLQAVRLGLAAGRSAQGA